MERVLLLWDIDGTLLANPSAAGHSHLDEFLLAVSRASGTEELVAPDKIDGSTDFAIIHSILENSGFTGSQADALFIPALRELERITTDPELIAASRSPVPGAPETLAALQGEQYISTYATGNSPHRAQAKTGYFGLDQYLDPGIGGFGWWTPRRADFVARAVHLARDKFPQVELIPVVIGDTPSDIAAAKDCQLRSVAVAAGVFSAQQLAQCQPDLVLDDFSGHQLGEFLLALES